MKPKGIGMLGLLSWPLPRNSEQPGQGLLEHHPLRCGRILQGPCRREDTFELRPFRAIRCSRQA
jgi:hypothetical protein